MKQGRYLVSTVHRGYPLEASGELLLVDLDNEQISVLCKVPLPYYPEQDIMKAYGGKRGFRGIRILGDHIVVATFDSILMVSLCGNIDEIVSSKLFSDLHGIDIDSDKGEIWVTSTGIDAIIVLEFDGSIKDTIFLAEQLFPERKRFIPKNCDFRRPVLTQMIIHPNYVFLDDEKAYVCCRALGGVVEIERYSGFTKLRYEFGEYKLPHDARLHFRDNDTYLLLSETGTGILHYKRIRISNSNNDQKDQLGHFGALDPRQPSSRGRTNWLRGLARLPDGRFVAGQSPARIMILQNERVSGIWKLDDCSSSSVFDILPVPTNLEFSSRLPQRKADSLISQMALSPKFTGPCPKKLEQFQS